MHPILKKYGTKPKTKSLILSNRVTPQSKSNLRHSCGKLALQDKLERKGKR